MIKRLRELVTDPQSPEITDDDPLSQMLLNSHSPVVLAALNESEAMFADMVSTVDPTTRTVIRKTRFRPVSKTRQIALPFHQSDEPHEVSQLEVDNYLSTANREI